MGRLALPKPAPHTFDALFKIDSQGRMTISMIDSNPGASDISETDEELPAVPSNSDVYISMIDSNSGVGDTLRIDEELPAVPPNMEDSEKSELPLIVVPGCNDALAAKPSSIYSMILEPLRQRPALVSLIITGLVIVPIPIAINVSLSRLKPGKASFMQPFLDLLLDALWYFQ